MAANLVDFAQELKAKIPIDQLIAIYVPDLARRGLSIKARCPFHDEKTASFNVSVERGFYHCFGCGASGDAIKFIMQFEKVDFPLAVETLARHFNIPMPEFARGDRPAVNRDEREKTREALLAVCKNAEAFFIDQFWRSPAAEPARAYMFSRGLTEPELKTYRIGFAPPDYDAFLSHARRSGYTPERTAEAGLAIAKESGGFYDRFRNRIMFPITDRDGRVIAFGGRLVEGDGPKYLNSAESSIFHKGKQLYGMAMAREAIRREGRVVLLEGYMDWIAMHSAGFENSLAGLGTAFTEEQAKLIRAVCGEAVLAYDGDAAGRKAAHKSAELLLARGLNVRIISLPDGDDPDSFTRANGPAAMRERIERARSALDFFVDEAVGKWPPGSPESKRDAVAFLKPLLTAISDPVLRDGYLSRVGARLGLEASTLEKALAKSDRPKFGKPGAEPARSPRPARPAAAAPPAYAEGDDRPPAPPDGPDAGGEGLEESESFAPPPRAAAPAIELLVLNRLIRLGRDAEIFEKSNEEGPLLHSELFTHQIARRVFEAIHTASLDQREGGDYPEDAFALATDDEERDLIARALMNEADFMHGRGDLRGDLPQSIVAPSIGRLTVELWELVDKLRLIHSRRFLSKSRSQATSGGHAENLTLKTRHHAAALRVVEERNAQFEAPPIVVTE